jgi:hypothetical protein
MDDTLALLTKLNEPLDPDFALTLGSNLDANVSIDQAAKVLSAAPMEIILQSSPDAIINNIQNIDFGNMDDSKISVLVDKIVDGATPDALRNMMQKATVDILNFIPFDAFESSGLNISLFKPTQLPDSVVLNFAEDKLDKTPVNDLIDDTNTLPKIIAGMGPNDFEAISSSKKLDAAFKLLTAANLSKPLSSIQVI